MKNYTSAKKNISDHNRCRCNVGHADVLRKFRKQFRDREQCSENRQFHSLGECRK